MIDLLLFAGRILLVGLLYVFLLTTMRTGIGLVRGQRRDAAIWSVDVEKGSKALKAGFSRGSSHLPRIIFLLQFCG